MKKGDFGKSLKSVHRLLPNIEPNTIDGYIETDTAFIETIQEIAQNYKTQKQNPFKKQPQLSDEVYDEVKRIGELHSKANVFNSTSMESPEEIDSNLTCECGCRRSFGQYLPYCTDEQQPFFGSGVILFFFYAKRIFFVVLVCVLIYGIFSLTTNLISSQAQIDCTNSGLFEFLCQLKIKQQFDNKTGIDKYIIPQLWLGFVFCLFWMVAIIYIKKSGQFKDLQIDDLLDSASDHHIFIRNLPSGNYYEQQILEFIQQLWDQIPQQKEELKIKSVKIIYKMEEVRKQIKDISKLANRLVKCIDRKDSKGYEIKSQKKRQYTNLKVELLKSQQELYNFRKNFLENWYERDFYTASCAFVQFPERQQMQLFLRYYDKTSLEYAIHSFKIFLLKKENPLEFNGNVVTIAKANEPSNILWDNCELQFSVKRNVITWFISFCLTGASFGALQGLRAIKQAYPDQQWLSIMNIVLINLFNRLIWNILQKVVMIEKNKTKALQIQSVMKKSYVSQLIMIIIVPLVINGFQNNKINGPNGLAGQVHDFQFTAFVFMALFNLVNVPYILTRIIRSVTCIRNFFIRSYCQVIGQVDTIQEIKDAITFIYDPPLVPVAGIYVYITATVSQAFFFCHLSPIILFYLLINLILFHLINKYLIIKRCKIPDLLDISIFKLCTRFAANIPLLYGVASILFIALRGDARDFSYYVPSILCIILWIINSINPRSIRNRIGVCLIEFFHKKPDEQQNQSPEKQYPVSSRAIQGSNGNLKKLSTVQKRLQNYYKGMSLNILLNYENKLTQVKGLHHNSIKKFCERFKLTGQ